MAALQLRRGARIALPAKAAVGEPLIATDTRELFIGMGLAVGDPNVIKIGDVVFGAVAPTVDKEKLWVNTTTNSIYRAADDGSAWLACTASLATAVDLGGLAPSDLVAPSQKAVKSYIDTAVSAVKVPTEWPSSVISKLATPPTTPTTGDRYLVIATATDAWTGLENQIVEYSGTTWVPTVCTTGTYLSVDADTTGLYYFGGTTWTKKSYELNTAGSGIDITAGVISLNSSIVAADGSGGLVYDAVNGVLSIGTIDGGMF